MEGRADDLGDESQELPQPGTEERDENGPGDATEGPGNVSIDEPTDTSLDPDDDEGQPA